MKLYNLRRGDRFKLAGDDNSPIFKLDHLDGMYSVCYMMVNNKPDLHVYHLTAFTPVIKVSKDEP